MYKWINQCFLEIICFNISGNRVRRSSLTLSKFLLLQLNRTFPNIRMFKFLTQQGLKAGGALCQSFLGITLWEENTWWYTVCCWLKPEFKLLLKDINVYIYIFKWIFISFFVKYFACAVLFLHLDPVILSFLFIEYQN